MKLEELLKQSECTVPVGGKNLFFRRWTSRQSFRFIGVVVSEYGKLSGSNDLLNIDVAKLLENSLDVLMPVAAETICNDKNDFKSVDDAVKWLDGLDVFDLVKLFGIIFRQNFPDKKKALELAEVIPPMRKLVQRLSDAGSTLQKSLTGSPSKK